MSGTNSPQGGLTRRTFLKTTAAAAGATAALGGAGAMTALAADEGSQDAGEQVFSGACRGNCMGGCPVTLTVREDKIVRVDAAETTRPEYQRICQRGRSSLQTVYNEQRIKYPMRRVEGTARGAGEWERITWDEAIDEICTKWQSYQQQYGPASIAFSHGSGNYGLAYGAYISIGYVCKLQNAIHAVNLNHQYDSASTNNNNRLNMSLGLMPHTLTQSKCIVLWGVNVTESVIHTWHFIQEAHQNGAKLIVVNPNYVIAASKADLWVPIRPATDGVLALALTNMALERGYADWAEIKRSTTMPFLLKETGGYLRVSDTRELAEGEADEELVMDASGNLGKASEVADPVLTGVAEANGQKVVTLFDAIVERIAEWTVDRAAEICDIPAETIEEMFDLYVNNAPVATMNGLSLDHYCNGTISYSDIALFSAVTGNIAKIGGGVDQFDIPALSFFANIAPFFMLGMSTSPDVPFIGLPDIMESGKWGAQDVPIKSIFVMYNNPVGNMVERKAMLEAIDKLELFVVSEVVMTDTARYADIVLPSAHYYEQYDAFMLYSPFLTLQERAVAPLYEAKGNYELIQLLAKGLGLGDYFAETEEDFLATIVSGPTLEAFGMTWERLKREKVIAIENYDGSCLSAADGRVNFYFGEGGRYTGTPGYGGFYDYGQEWDKELYALPGWETPHEAWTVSVDKYEKTALSEKYPLIYTTYRNKMKCHTQFGYNPWLLEIFPEPYVMMNEEDMLSRGLEDASLVRIFNDRGEVVMKVMKNNGIRKGMVVIPKGWQEGQFVSGHYSDLTSRYMNPAVPNNYYYDALCEIEPYTGGEN